MTDLDGQLVGTIANQQGATGVALSADGTIVYAALGDGDAVSAIDTATLTERARLHLPVRGDRPHAAYPVRRELPGRQALIPSASATPPPS